MLRNLDGSRAALPAARDVVASLCLGLRGRGSWGGMGSWDTVLDVGGAVS